MADYVRGDAVRIRAEFYDPDTTAETAVTPSTITVSVFDPAGSQVVNEATMTAVSGVTGAYKYDYQTTVTSLIGIYTYRISAVVSAVTGRIRGSFTLSKETEV